MVGTTFTTDLQGLKRLARDFLLSLEKNPSEDEAEAGFKCLTLHYFGCEYVHPADEIMAVSTFKYASKHYMEWQFGQGYL